MKINPKFTATKTSIQVYFQPMHSSSSNTEGTDLKYTVLLWVDNVQKKCKLNIVDKFLRLYASTDSISKK